MTREEAKRILYVYRAINLVDASHREAFDMAISELEQEPKTGHWVKSIGENGITPAVRCSECGFEDNRYMLFRYCPNCGAKMKEGN